MTDDAALHLETWNADRLAGRLDEMAALLHACVHAGASVGFILPHPPSEARAFWVDRILPAVAAGGRRLMVAERGGRVVGTVQLVLDTPANQPHRAEVSKLLVHPDARRQGIARTLMTAALAAARTEGRTLLTLDTRTGDAGEPLYIGLGFRTGGVIRGYCLHPSGQGLEDTTVMYLPLT